MQSHFDKHLIQLSKEFELKSTDDFFCEIDKVTKAICEIMEVERASIWIFGDNKSSIKCESLYDTVEKKHTRDLKLFKKDFEPYFRAMEIDRIIEANDAHSHPATSCFSESYLTPLGINSMYDTPIWKSDKVIGVLCLEYLRPKSNWTDQEKNFITSVADFLGKIYEKLSVLELIEHLEERVENRTQDLSKALDDLKSTQKTLIEKEKLASLGVVIAGVSHELKNPLTHILNSSELIIELINEGNESKEELLTIAKIIEDAAKRADKIIRNMLSQAVSENEQEVFDVGELVESTVKLVLHYKKEDVNFNPVFSFDLTENTKILGSKQKLQQVFINIFENALHSMYEKFSAQPSYSPEIKISLRSNADKWELLIRDNGNGMSQSTIESAFNPFYTTKPSGEGTGLGLSISYDIIQSHGGDISISSDGSRYVEFKIVLPIHRQDELKKGA